MMLYSIILYAKMQERFQDSYEVFRKIQPSGRIISSPTTVFHLNLDTLTSACHLERSPARDPKPYAYASGSTGALAPALRMTAGGTQSKPKRSAGRPNLARFGSDLAV